MKKTSASILLALMLDFIFGILFIILLSQWSSDKEEITLHMNQVGMYKEIENSESKINQMNEIGLQAYRYQKEDLYIVITSIHLDKNQVLEEQKILIEHEISFILKEITTSDVLFVETFKKGDMNKLMELMSNKS